MTRLTIFVPLAEEEREAISRAIRLAGLAADSPVRVSRRSLDARKGRPIGHQLELVIGAEAPSADPPRSRVRAGAHIVVIGSGPAGTFGARELAAAGARVTLVERGRPVQPRRHDLAQLTRGTLVADS